MKFKYYWIAGLLLMSTVTLGQKMSTEVYYQNDSTRLEVDLFTPKKASKEKQPLFIFVHGGGFTSGNKTGGHPICKYLAERGIVTASIQYTLYMKDKSFSCDGITSEKVKAIQYSANQLKMATLYFLENADSLNIDPTKIFIAGSSAGAESILHTQYWGDDAMDWYGQTWPEDFRYAGMIASSGAIMDLNLIRKDNAIPTLLSHGTCDAAVPYGTAPHHHCSVTATGWLMLFGSHSIYEHLQELNKAVKLYSYCGGGHGYFSQLFQHEMNIVHDFILECLKGSLYQEHIIVPTSDSCEDSQPSFCD